MMSRARVRSSLVGVCALTFFTSAFSQTDPATQSVLQSCARIMPLGDSITLGVNGGYRNDLFTGLQQNNCGVTYVGTQYDIFTTVADKHHEGHIGYTIDNIATNVNDWLASTQPDIIALMIGTNDIASWNPDTPDKIAARHNALIDQLEKARPDAWIFVASIPPETSVLVPPLNLDRSVQVSLFNALIKKNIDARVAAGEHVRFVDVNSALTVADLRSDGIHPLESSYGKVAQKFLDAIRTALGAAPAQTQTVPADPPVNPTPTPAPPPAATTSPATSPPTTSAVSPTTNPPAQNGGGSIHFFLALWLIAFELWRARGNDR